jgi:hypothetical protein
MKTGLGLFLFCAGLLISTGTLAVDKYDVELIIFERTARSAALNETWPEDPGRPDLHKATHITSNKGLYARLPNSRRTLTDVAKRMRRASGKPVRLAHMLWRQPAVSKKEATPIHVAGKTKTGNLIGTARVSVRRYLHLDLDLLLETTNGPAPGRFRMQAHRRMRSGKLHYIDHPIMGALVRITPVK